MNTSRWITGSVAASLVLGMFAASAQTPAGAQGDSQTFPQTGKTVKGLFLKYWQQNGALPQQGFPITDEFQERSPTDGKTYTMQCFERAVFENHPENAGKPSEVLLSLLGNFEFKRKYQFGAPTGQKASTDNPRVFPETGKTLGGKFRQYWEANGGLAQQGFPISDEFPERSETDGKTYTVQYFERAVFEYHPENAGTQFEVLLSLLGVRHCPANKPAPTGTPRVNPTATRVPTVAPSPTPNPSFDPNKLYKLTTEFGGDSKCLEARADGGSSLTLQNCRTIQYQHWRIRAGSGGTWQLSVELSGGNFNKCLDTQLLADCGNKTGQFWTIKPFSGGYYTMTNAFTGPGKCLEIASSFPQAQMSTCGNFTNQAWKFTEVR